MTHALVKIYNPTLKDFSTTYDYNEDGNPPTYTLHAKEIEAFPAPIADHLKRHLAYQIASERQDKSNFSAQYELAVREIETT